LYVAYNFFMIIVCSGLNNDHVAETFTLRHTINGNFFPCRYVRIGEWFSVDGLC